MRTSLAQLPVPLCKAKFQWQPGEAKPSYEWHFLGSSGCSLSGSCAVRTHHASHAGCVSESVPGGGPVCCAVLCRQVPALQALLLGCAHLAVHVMHPNASRQRQRQSQQKGCIIPIPNLAAPTGVPGSRRTTAAAMQHLWSSEEEPDVRRPHCMPDAQIWLHFSFKAAIAACKQIQLNIVQAHTRLLRPPTHCTHANLQAPGPQERRTTWGSIQQEPEQQFAAPPAPSSGSRRLTSSAVSLAQANATAARR